MKRPDSYVFVATTLEADLGGISRVVPAIASAVSLSDSLPGKSQTKPIVHLIGPRPEESVLRKQDIERLDYITLCADRSAIGAEVDRFLREGGKPRFIYHAGVWTGINHRISCIGRETGIPIIGSTHSMLDPWALNHRKWKKRLAWWAYARRDLLSATAIHATAELEAGYIRKALGEKCPPVIVVPNGVDLPGVGEKLTTEHKENTEKKALRRVLFLSRIHEKKGVLDLIKAFGELDPDGWELVVAGNDDGNHQAVCESLATEQPNAEQISFPGAVSDADKWDLYRSADLFVLPSYSENFGIVIGEALGMGVPVITTNETPWGEYARGKSLTKTQRDQDAKEDYGLWVVETGVQSIKAAMTEAMALGDEARKARGARGAEWIRNTFSWEAIGKKFLEELEKVLNGKDALG